MSADIIQFNLNIDLKHDKIGYIDKVVDKTLYTDRLQGNILFIEPIAPKSLNINTKSEISVEL